MARKRMIDPRIWEDEHFGKLSDKAKLLFIACISNADDEGKLSANPANLRAIAFRFDENINLPQIENLSQEIAENLPNFKYYNVNGSKYIQLAKWNEYQKQREERVQPSKYPSFFDNVSQMSVNRQSDVSQPSAQIRLDKISIDKISSKQASPAPKGAVNSVETVDNSNNLLKTQFEEVYKSGLNIYALINKLKKQSKVGAEIPEVVLLRVFEAWKKEKGQIKEQWSWFCKVVVAEWEKYNTEQEVKEGQEWKKPILLPPAIKQILAGLVGEKK